MEALSPDYKPLTNSQGQGTVVNMTVIYYRYRTKADAYTTRYYWHRPPTRIQVPLMSEEISMDRNGIAVLKIASFPEDAVSVRIHAAVSLVSSPQRFAFDYNTVRGL